METLNGFFHCGKERSYRVGVTVIGVFRKEQRVSGEDEDGFEDEGDKQLDVNVVPSAVQFPEETFKSER